MKREEFIKKMGYNFKHITPKVGKGKLHEIYEARAQHRKLPKVKPKPKGDKPIYKQLSIEDYESGAYDEAKKIEKELQK